MIRTTLAAFFLRLSIGVLIEQRNQISEIIPNVFTKIDPLHLKIAGLFEQESDIFKIQIICSQEIKSHFKFKNLSNFCDGLSLIGTCEQLNNSLEEIQVKSDVKFSNEIESGSIQYIVTNKFDSKQISKKLQMFKFAEKLNFFVEKDIIRYDPKVSLIINESIGHLASKFVENRSFLNFTIFSEEGLPAESFTFKMIENRLILSGVLNKDFDQNIPFRLKILDNVSNLMTNSIVIDLVFSGNLKSDQIFLFYSIFGLFISVIVFGFVLCYVIQNSEEIENYPPQEYSRISKNHKILTKSITDWTNSTQHKSMKKGSISSEIEDKTTVNDSNIDIEGLRNVLKSEKLPEIKQDEVSFAENDGISTNCQNAEFNNISNITITERIPHKKV